MLLHGINLTAAQLKAMTDRPPFQVEYVVIHHTADNDQHQSIEDVAAGEIVSQGFVTVGYHYIVMGDGTVQIGRPLNKKPAANIGLNVQSVAISLEGNFHPSDSGYKGEVPSEAAIKSAITIVNNLLKPQCPNLRRLIGHRDVSRIVARPDYATACPGDILYARLHDIRVATQLLDQ